MLLCVFLLSAHSSGEHPLSNERKTNLCNIQDSACMHIYIYIYVSIICMSELKYVI